MFELKNLSADERRLLILFESCLVEHGGTVDDRTLGGGYLNTARGWDALGFISFGRRNPRDVPAASRRTLFVWLTPEAMQLAQAERRRRALAAVLKHGEEWSLGLAMEGVYDAD